MLYKAEIQENQARWRTQINFNAQVAAIAIETLILINQHYKKAASVCGKNERHHGT